MSAGKFDRDGKYLSNVGNVYRCRPQLETKGLILGGFSNSYPIPAPTAGVGSVALRASRRSLGVLPRSVSVRLLADGTGPTGDYEGLGTLHRVVVFRSARYNQYTVGVTGTYLGIACEVVSRQPEIVR